MKITALVENTSNNSDLAAEHGLSLYIETAAHKILFDTGASDLFARNADKLGIDLTKVDIVVISHGHSDHGGGLATFLQKNKEAKVYFAKQAFEPHFANAPNSQKVFIGLAPDLLPNPRFVFVDQGSVIDEELELFAEVKGNRYLPSANQTLLKQGRRDYLADDFAHEQNLIIKEKGSSVLIAGCAHRGIVNILDHYQKSKGKLPDVVIGGFHLYNRGTDESEDPAVVEKIAEILLKGDTKYYTCHCTGERAYARLKDLMGERIDYLDTGRQISI